jgi:hypothetical protein
MRWTVRGSNPGRGNRFFSKTPRPALRPTQLPVQWVPGVKRPWREVNLSSPSSAEVKNEWSCASVSRIRLHGVGREKFRFAVNAFLRLADTRRI